MIAQDFLRSVFRPQILHLSAYKVSDARNLIKLDAMENPYIWPTELTNRWLEVLRDCQLNRYPDPHASKLASALRAAYDINDSTGLLLGNGSDEIIQMLLMALPTGSTVLAPEPGFVMYKQVALSLELNYLGVPLIPESFALDLPAMLNAIAQHAPALIFIAYPNNPTGNLFNPSDINHIIQAAPGLVVIDEAYAPFADASYMAQLPHYTNLLVMRTVSKLGLAGLRLGYMAGYPEIIAELDKIRLPYNINTLTQISAEFALNNPETFTTQTALIRQERELMLQALNALEGITAFPSAANFILFRTPATKAHAIFEHIKQQGILIKNLTHSGGLLEDCLRVTIGTPQENTLFLQALKKSLQKLS